MSDAREVDFAIVRGPEIEALQEIGQKSAWAVWVKLKQRFRDGKQFRVSARDFDDCKVGHEAATAAIRAFVKIGMLKEVSAPSRIRGQRGLYEFLHTRESCKVAAASAAPKAKVTGGKSATPRRVTGGKSDSNCRVTGGKSDSNPKITGGFSAIPLGASSPPAQKPGGEEAERFDRERGKAAVKRQARLAGELRLPLMALVRQSGSTQAANALALKWERDAVPLTVVRQWLADGQEKTEARARAGSSAVIFEGLPALAGSRCAPPGEIAIGAAA